jgi:hypothetical protein
MSDSTAAYDYPSPVFAVSEADLGDENLLRIAREMLDQHESVPAFPRATINPGDRVLFVFRASTIDERVQRALSRAIGEITSPPDFMVSNAPVIHPRGGEAELESSLCYYTGPKHIEREMGFTEKLVNDFCTGGGYDVLICGDGSAYSAPGSQQKAFRRYGLSIWRSADLFASGLANFPPELQLAIDTVGFAALRQARKVHVTDPEGTDVSWGIRPGDFELSQARLGMDIPLRGHLNAIPWGPPPPVDGNGVISGTLNGHGPFPHIAVHVEDSQIVRIEGGGRYGEGWWKFIEQYKDAQYPLHPGPGWRWLMECAIGTNPKVLRPRTAALHGNYSDERLRSGALHIGLGAAIMAPGERASVEAFAEDRATYSEYIKGMGLPDGHFHVHAYFATIDVETTSGDIERLVDGGRLCALDHPKVRAVAEQHGDPEKLLAPAWVPAIPGINAPGEYTNYARNPVSHIEGD